MSSYLALALLCISLFSMTYGGLKVPKLSLGPKSRYIHEGDINIGALFGMTTMNADGTCSSDLSSLTRLEMSESIVYAIKNINDRNDILPNITLGWVYFNDCSKDLNSLAYSVYFVEDGADVYAPRDYWMPPGEQSPHYKVAGIVGPISSRQSVMVASFLSIFEVPIISPFATSDELNDKSRYEYFLRMSPPDMYQTYCLVAVLEAMDWTYVSFLYSEGNYGENGAKQFELQLASTSICLAFTAKVPSLPTEKDFDEIVEKLTESSSARVVVLFISSTHEKGLYHALQKTGMHDYFVFVGTDYSTPSNFNERGDGNIALDLPRFPHEEFNNYYFRLNPHNTPENPWMKDHWSMGFGCSWNATDDEESCDPMRNMSDIRKPSDTKYIYIDMITVYGYALDYIVKTDCPEASEDKSLLETCVNGPRLLEVLKNLTFQGYNGPIEFDEYGNLIGQYEVFQYVHEIGERIKIGVWDQQTLSLKLFEDTIRWDILQRKARFLNKTIDQNQYEEIPVSKCSTPCPSRRYYVYKELPCCWECKECRNNEIIVDNSTSCEACDPLTWPDDDNATFCVKIIPTYLRWTDSIAIALATLNTLGCILTICVLVLYILNRNEKLIKASSRELSLIILTGITLAYITVFFGLAKPGPITCSINRYGFNIAVTLIYGPLMVRTNRIYRIFSAGKRGTKRPFFVSSQSQLIMAFILIFLQIILTTVAGIMYPPISKERMKVLTEKHVELYCDLPLYGLVPSLAYNICLMLLCAVFGFLTRTLPQNFNESGFIFVSVSTTSFLWVVILPTYFTQFYAYNQAILLSVCLIVNAIVTLFLLYIPKIYALYFVKEENLKFGTMTLSTDAGPSRSQVAPVSD